jgi:hypothetical protein
VTEIDVDFQKDNKRSREEVLNQIRQNLNELFGVSYSVGQPIAHLIDHMMSGVSAQIAIKIFGNDLQALRELAIQLKDSVQSVPGLVDLRLEQQGLLPQAKIHILRDEAAKYGISAGEMTEVLEKAFNGEEVAQILEDQKFFEDYGFQIYFKQYTYMRPVQDLGFDEKMIQRANAIMANPDYSFRYIQGKELQEKAPEYFMTVYNKAWARHMGKSIALKEAQLMFGKMKPIIDPRLIYFAFFKGEPVGFFIQIPEINQIFKHVNGKMDLIGKLKFLWYKTFSPPNKMLGLVFGVVPEHQAKGVESAMIISYDKMSGKSSFPYKTIEMNWIGDFNPKMMRVCEQLLATIYKTHHTYRYLFDREKPFERHPIFD